MTHLLLQGNTFQEYLYLQYSHSTKRRYTLCNIQNRKKGLFVNRAELLDLETAFDITTYLYREHSFFPWRMFDQELAYFKEVLPASPIYKEFSVKKLLSFPFPL